MILIDTGAFIAKSICFDEGTENQRRIHL